MVLRVDKDKGYIDLSKRCATAPLAASRSAHIAPIRLQFSCLNVLLLVCCCS